MFATSQITGAVAAVPLLPSTTKETPLTIQFPNSSTPLTLSLPACFDDAIKTSKYSFDWFIDQDTSESSTEPNLPQLKSIVEKKSKAGAFVRGLTWSVTGSHLAITLDSYIFLLYQIDNNTENGITAELITVIGFPRHMGMVTMTPNGKNWIITDAVGDFYGFSHQKIISGNQKQIQQLLYSIGTLCLGLQGINTQSNGQNDIENGGKDYLLSYDTEAKIRVSNLPHFFDIQSFCMGGQGPQTGIVQLKTISKITGKAIPSNFIISTNVSGYIRERLSDPESGFLPYTPTKTSILVHDISNGNIALKPYQINNDNLWEKNLCTQHSTAVYYGLGAIFQENEKKNNDDDQDKQFSTFLYASPTLSTCFLNSIGHLEVNMPLSYRTSINNLVCIQVNTPTSTVKDNNGCLSTPIVERNIKISNLPSWFDLENDLIHHIHPTLDQKTFFIQTITNKIIQLSQEDDGNHLSLKVISSYNFSKDVLHIPIPSPQSTTPSTIQTPILPSLTDFTKRYDTVNYGVGKYINFHWRFERAPNRQAAQRREHLAQALRGGDIVPGDLDDEADPNQLVQLGKE